MSDDGLNEFKKLQIEILRAITVKRDVKKYSSSISESHFTATISISNFLSVNKALSKLTLNHFSTVYVPFLGSILAALSVLRQSIP
jgi:hypothetical protein